MNKWFVVNRLSLNKDKTSVIKFNLNHLQDDSFQILYKDIEIKEVTNIKFLGLGVTNIWSGWLVLTKYYQE
jgi:hypothetical protein